MGSAFHQLCQKYSGSLTPTAPTAIKLYETVTFLILRNDCSPGPSFTSIFTAQDKLNFNVENFTKKRAVLIF